MKKIALITGFLFISFISFAQLLSWSPQFVQETTTPFTITMDASKGNQGLNAYTPTTDVYVHIGVITNLSTGPSDWQYSKFLWGTTNALAQASYAGSNKWTYTITGGLRTFFGLPAGETIQQIAIIFRNGNGVKSQRNTDGSEMYIPVTTSSLASRFSVPLMQPKYVPVPETITRVVGNTIPMTGLSNTQATLRLYFNGSVVQTATSATTVSAAPVITNSGNQALVFEATDGVLNKRDTINFYVPGPVTIAALPAGVRNGINYGANNTEGTLVLYAPGKARVGIIGDLPNSNWIEQATYQMKKTPDGNYWWLTLSGLTPGFEYSFQYLIDGTLKIAEPFSEKIQDPNADQFILPATYPGLKPYPNETSGIVSILQTAAPTYTWQNTTFVRPDKRNIIIYELLLRDFVAAHDWNTLRDSLNYLKRLGINAIELMPANEFEGNESWGYNPDFYFAPDKYYGPANTMKRFIDSCHSRGIAVIMDVALNQSSGMSPLAQLYWDVANNRPLPNNPWFNPVPKHSLNGGYDMNHESLATRYFVSRVMEHWVINYKIDGFRFELSKGFTQTQTCDNMGANCNTNTWNNYDASRIAIWKRYFDSLQLKAPGAYAILEHFADNSEETELSNYGMMLWGNSNYNYSQASMGLSTNWNFDNGLSVARGWANPHLVTYMESHAEERLMYRNLQSGNSNGSYNTSTLPTALKRMEMNAAFFLTLPGPKMIWQFGELGYDYSINTCSNLSLNSSCIADKKPLRWDYLQQPDRLALSQVYGNLNRLRTTPGFSNLFTSGAITRDFSGPFKWHKMSSGSYGILAIGNFDVVAQAGTVSFPFAGTWYDYLTGATFIATGGNQSFNLQPGEYKIFTSQLVALQGNSIPPVVISFTPTSALSGGTVTITGSDFTGATVVTFGGTSATSFTIVNATTITAVVSAGASGNVSVTTAGGTASLPGFTFLPPPTITSFTPASGCQGTTVTINGTNFTGTTGVSIGGIAVASFTINSPMSITAVVGANMAGTITVTTPNGTGTSSSAFFYGSSVAPFAYIASEGNNIVSVVNTLTNTVTSTIPVGTNPTGVSVSSNGSRVYVSNKFSNNVSVINTATNSVIATIPVGTNPIGITTTPDGSKVYVSNYGSNTISVISTNTNSVTATIPVGNNPNGITVSPDGSKVYVSNYGGSNISVINTSTNTVSATITVGLSPYGICVSSDGSRIYVANSASNNVSVINSSTSVIVATIATGTFPVGVALSPDGSRLYVGNNQAANVSVINTVTNTVIATVGVGTGPQGISVTPDGSKVLAVNGSNNVSVINTATNAVSTTIGGVGTGPYSLGSFIGNVVIPCPPTISSFTPVTANTGTTVTISGTNFTDATAVSFGGIAATSFLIVNATTITAAVGMGASGSVSVTTPGGTAALPGFTFLPPPSITNFTPATACPGSSITLTGFNFTGATSVSFGGTPAASFAVVNATTITAVVGGGSTGVISVTTPYGTATGNALFSIGGTSTAYAYITKVSGNSVSVINTVTNAVIANISTGTSPWGVGVSGDGNKVYISNYASNNISVISTATNTVVATVAVGTNPTGVAVSPDDSRVYVSNYGSASVSMINTATNTVTSTIGVGSNPHGIAISPDGSKVYVSNFNSNSISIINTATNTVTATLAVGVNPTGINFNSSGNRAYVANYTSATLSVINTVTSTVIANIPIGVQPNGVTVSLDGSQVYVANSGSNSVSVINTSTNLVTATISVGTTPVGISLSSDGTKLYVANYGGTTVSVINVATNTVSASVNTTTAPFALGNFIANVVTACPPAIASFSPTSGSVGTLVTVTGSNLAGLSSFTIGGVSAINVSNDGTTLVGLVMPGAITGSVSVTAAGGTANGLGNFTVTPTPYPSTQQGAKLVGTGVIGNSAQGISSSISADGNTAIVGGQGQNSTGAAWIYTRSGGVWSQQGSALVGSAAIGSANQGRSVTISADGNTAMVGGYVDNGGIGAVWVYSRSGGIWTQQGPKLVGTGAIGNSFQGQSVALSADGNIAVVGGYGDNAFAGAVWIFTRSAGVWSQQGSKLVGTGATGPQAARQGLTVSISSDGNTVILGGELDNNGVGAAWVFIRSGGVWSQQGTKLTGIGTSGTTPAQGSAVALSADGNTAIVGGRGDNVNIGAAWVFTRSGGAWSQQGSKLVGTGAPVNAFYGGSVSISADGNTAIVGGPSGPGAAWVYTRSGGIWAQRGAKLEGTGAIGNAAQGRVAISSDGTTAIVGGFADNSSIGAAWIFTVAPPPVIMSFTPTAASSGTVVTIAGSNFTGATSVSFGGTSAVSFTVVNATTITAIVGAGTTGNVSVTTPDGTAILPGFTFLPPPTITTFTPANGCPGTNVTITGTNFTGATAVKFGGTDAASFTVNSATSITAIPASAATGLISVVTPSGSTTSSSTFTIGGASASYAYITNTSSNTVSVINGSTNTVIATVIVGNSPFGVSVSPDGSKVYVVNRNSNNVSVISTVTNTVTGTIVVGNTPFGISVSPDGSKVYVTNSSDNTVSVINTATNTVTGTINVGTNPFGITVSADGSKVYVANFGGNTVSVINTATNAMVATIAVGNRPLALCVSPDNTKVYVTNELSNTVSVINTITNVVSSTISVGNSPACISINSDGSRLYVANRGASNNVSVIDATTNTSITSIPVGNTPVGVSVSADGTRVYTANYGSNDVSVINTVANAVISTIAVGINPQSFGNFVSTIVAPCVASITSFSPASASTGTTITITGNGFTGATSVSFGGTAAASFTVVNSTTITAVVASGSSGTVSVTTPLGIATLAGFTYSCPVPTVNAPASWNLLGNAGFSVPNANFISFSLDGNNNPIVASSDGSSSSSIMQLTFNDWTSVGSASFVLGSYTRTAVNSAGNVYVISDNKKVYVYNGTSWSIVGGTDFTTNNIAQTDIAISSSGTPYIVYYDYTAAGIIVKQFNGVNWVQVGTTVASMFTDNSVGIALDGASTPYVVYNDFAVNGISVKKYNAGGWVQVGVAGFMSPGAFNYSNIVVDGSGSPYVVAYDVSASTVRVRKFNGSSWITIGADITNAGLGPNRSISLDASGTPYISYYSNAGFGSNVVAKLNAGNWVSQGTLVSNYGYGTLALDGNNVTYFASGDAANSGKTSVYRYNALATISGNAAPVAGSTQTYSVTPYTGATTYNWTLPIGWSGSSNTNSITVTVGQESGPIRVTASNNCGSAVSVDLDVYVTVSPSITSFTPSNGCANTANVVITGTNLSGATAVNFGGSAAASFVVNSSTQITAIPATGSNGIISITTPSGVATSSNSFTINALPTASITGNNSFCVGSNTTLTSNATAGSGTITLYQWKESGVDIANANSATYSATTAGSYSVRITNSNGCVFTSPAYVVSVTPTFTIAASSGANGNISPAGSSIICSGNSQAYTITPNACYSIADVIVDGVSQGATGTYTFTNVTANHTISATFVLNTYTIAVTAGANGSITPGTGSVNCGSNATYTITPNACYSIADVIVDGVSQGAIGTYTFTNVTATHTISASFALNAPLTAPVVSGPVNVCPYIGTGTQLTYSVPVVPGATSYNWTVPVTVSIVSGQGTPNLVVTINNGFTTTPNKQIRISVATTCGTTPQTVYVLVAQSPGTPQSISGPTSVCPIIGTPATFTYTIPSVVGATSYIWTAQAGTTTITHPNGPGPNDTTVNISFTNGFTSSNLTVRAANDSCGASNLRSLPLTKANPATPGLIAGSTNACPYMAPGGTPATYSVPAVAGQTYNWTVPAGAIGLVGQGTNMISFTYPSTFTSGSISVTTTNGCGTSGPRSLSINKLLPARPGVIDVIQTQPCPNRVYTYTISTTPASSTSVQWTVPAGATLVSGQGTTSITVSYPGTSFNSSVTAQAFNNCGSSTIRSTPVLLPTCVDDKQPATYTKAGSTITAVAEAMKVNVYPNPTVADFKLQVVTAGKQTISVRILDAQGRSFKTFEVMPYQTINVGAELKAGTYMMEVRQGNEVKVTKLLKF